MNIVHVRLVLQISVPLLTVTIVVTQALQHSAYANFMQPHNRDRHALLSKALLAYYDFHQARGLVESWLSSVQHAAHTQGTVTIIPNSIT
jgi:hypothetical protein